MAGSMKGGIGMTLLCGKEKVKKIISRTGRFPSSRVFLKLFDRPLGNWEGKLIGTRLATANRLYLGANFGSLIICFSRSHGVISVGLYLERSPLTKITDQNSSAGVDANC